MASLPGHHLPSLTSAVPHVTSDPSPLRLCLSLQHTVQPGTATSPQQPHAPGTCHPHSLNSTTAFRERLTRRLLNPGSKVPGPKGAAVWEPAPGSLGKQPRAPRGGAVPTPTGTEQARPRVCQEKVYPGVSCSAFHCQTLSRLRNSARKCGHL